MSLPLLAEGARAFDISLTPAQCDAFETLYQELVAWNARVNLTGITTREDVVVKHFLDSLSLVPVLRSSHNNRRAASQSPAQSENIPLDPATPALAVPPSISSRLIDIGTGAGFPGIPLKLVLPELRVTLLDATGKKVEFLNHIIALLGLRNTLAVQARAEDLGHDASHRARYDIAVARAVANLATLAEYALPFVRLGGLVIAQKGVDPKTEIQAATKALGELGGIVREVVPVLLPGLEPRHLILIEKTAPTSSKYPRRAGVPERKPL
jgi:16S rRNA (guanine527-N7)-methyltransferase